MSETPLAPCVQAVASGPEPSLDLFLRGFAARDIAESLASFDDTTSRQTMIAASDAHGFEVIGVRRAGILIAWLAASDLRDVEQPPLRPFEPAVIADNASLNEVVQALNSAPHVFVRTFGKVGGLICRRDLQKPAMRMWLFGLITISELRVTLSIDQYCPVDSWRQYLSEGRLQKAVDMQDERRRRGQSRALLDCLQFADKGRIVARDTRLRELTRFQSKREVEDFVVALQDLRNNLAHANDISDDWPVIFDLATNLHRIVLGPAHTAAGPTQPISA
jgi:hypothetical protein